MQSVQGGTMKLLTEKQKTKIALIARGYLSGLEYGQSGYFCSPDHAWFGYDDDDELIQGILADTRTSPQDLLDQEKLCHALNVMFYG